MKVDWPTQEWRRPSEEIIAMIALMPEVPGLSIKYGDALYAIECEKSWVRHRDQRQMCCIATRWMGAFGHTIEDWRDAILQVAEPPRDR